MKIVSVHDQLREHIYSVTGIGYSSKTKDSIEDLKVSEWSPLFEQLMRNRLIMGALRYGKIKAPGRVKYERIASIVKRIYAYKETGNAEYLVDIANLCLVEFEEPTHPAFHWSAVDDGEHINEASL